MEHIKCHLKDDSVPFFNVSLKSYALTGFSWFLKKKDDLKNKSYDNAKS